MHYLITGHTGFKGAWLIALLRTLGHTVSGLALDPLNGSLFSAAGMQSQLARDGRLDIRDAKQTSRFISECSPDYLIHLAAQPLVRASYRHPRATFETNVDGTMNVLEAIESTPSLRAVLVVTTDKVYRNSGNLNGYIEEDALGGHDPYSASKAMADLLSLSWANSISDCPLAVARAGNVIGGGDVSEDRLLPDLMRSFARGEIASVRSPASIRPWQHVLDCLWGYLQLVSYLDRGGVSGQAWNFGPSHSSFANVAQISSLAAQAWGAGSSWEAVSMHGPREAAVLTLDSSKARSNLGWREALSLEEAVRWTVHWYKSVSEGADPLVQTRNQIEAFLGRVT